MKVQDNKDNKLGGAQQLDKAGAQPMKPGAKLAEAPSFAKLLEGGEEVLRGEQEAGALLEGREAATLLGEREAISVEIGEQAVTRRELGDHEQGRALGRRAEDNEVQRGADIRAERGDQQAEIRADAQPEAPLAPRERAQDASGEQIERVEGASGAGGVAGGEQVKEAAPTADTARAEEVRKLAEQLVESCQTGLDQQGRQVMMLDVQVPGRGGVRVRLRRQGDGVEVRLRADNTALGDLLRARSGELRDAMAGRGVALSRLEVAG